MGIDLTLYPVSSISDSGEHTCFTKLPVELAWELRPLILKLLFFPVARPVSQATADFGSGFQTIEKDGYGTYLWKIKARDLITLSSLSCVQGDETNRAAWAYLAALEPSHEILIYWH